MGRRAVIVTLGSLVGLALAIAVNVATGGTLPGRLARYQGWAWAVVGLLGAASVGLAIWQLLLGSRSDYKTASPGTSVKVGGDFHDRSRNLSVGDVTGGNVVVIDHIKGDVSIHGVERPDLPSELPADIADFTGRDEEVARVLAFLEHGQGRQMTAVVISAISGQAGVGKTALAVHAAHLVRRRFPDGQLQVNLRGAEAQALDPGEVLRRFLRRLGIEDDKSIPEDLEERAALYRSRIADRRVLILLDNAASEAQVRPLLPGSPTCAALITSRIRLRGLEAARSLDLDVLEPKPATDLLARVIGVERVEAEPEVAEEIIALCGRLPLAIQIAGRRLADMPQLPLARLAEQLRDTRERLSVLRVGDLDVRTSFSWSYRGLQDEEERRLFRLLGLLRARDFPAWVAGAVLGMTPEEGARLIERLVDARLLEGGRGEEDDAGQHRYRYHDLLRDYAREQLEEEEPAAAPRRALERIVGGYQVLGRTANALLEPRDNPSDPHHVSIPRRAGVSTSEEPSRQDALAWFTAERASLVAAIEQASDAGLWRPTWQLAMTLPAFFEPRALWVDWRQTHDLALAATRQGGDREGEAQVLRSLGYLLRELGRPQEAVDFLEQSLQTFRALNDHLGEARVLCNFIRTYRDLGRFTDALACFQRALPAARALGDRWLEANILRDVGMAYRDHGDRDEALAHLEEALPLFQQVGDGWLEAYTVRDIGIVYRQQGRLAEANACFQQSLVVFKELGDRRGVARALNSLGESYREERSWGEAIAHLQGCLRIFQELGDRRWEAYTLRSLGDAHREQGLAATRRWLAGGFPRSTVLLLAQILGGKLRGRLQGAAGGHWEKAAASLAESRRILAEIGDSQWEAYTLRSFGDLHRAQGHWDEAITCFEQALVVFRTSNHRRLEAETLARLGEALSAKHAVTAAQAAWRNALDIYEDLGVTDEADEVRSWLRDSMPLKRGAGQN
jgi:tetratricopeptide (TPR) repeat protein